MPLPDIKSRHFNQPKSLHLSKVAIVTTAALHREGSHGFELGDSDFHYEILPAHARDISLGHHSVNFDRGGFAADINVVYPIDRLHEFSVTAFRSLVSARCSPFGCPRGLASTPTSKQKLANLLHQDPRPAITRIAERSGGHFLIGCLARYLRRIRDHLAVAFVATSM